MARTRKHGSFQAFYSAELQPLLVRLDRIRKKRLLIIGVAVLPLLLFVPTMIRHPILIGLGLFYGALLFGAARFVGGVVFDIDKKRIELQRDAVGRLVNYARPGLTHRPAEYVSAGDFVDSRLFFPQFNRYGGCNYCRYDDKDFEQSFSWLKIQRESQRERRKNTLFGVLPFGPAFLPLIISALLLKSRASSAKTVFMGWFFATRFRRHFTGGTLVLPDVAEARLGWLGRQLQELGTPQDMEMLLLENAAFEKKFKVLSTSQDDARHVLTPMVMEEMVNLASPMKSGLCVSFLRDGMFVAIPAGTDFFDAMLTHSLTDPGPLRELYLAVKGMNRLARTVARHTKVWQS